MDCDLCKGNCETIYISGPDPRGSEKLTLSDLNIVVFDCGRTFHHYCATNQSVDQIFKCTACHKDHDVNSARFLKKETPWLIWELHNELRHLNELIDVKEEKNMSFQCSYFGRLPDECPTDLLYDLPDICINCHQYGHDVLDCFHQFFLRETIVVYPWYDDKEVEMTVMTICFEALNIESTGEVVKLIIENFKKTSGIDLLEATRDMMSRILNSIIANFFYTEMCENCGNPYHQENRCDVMDKLNPEEKTIFEKFQTHLKEFRAHAGDDITHKIMETVSQ